MSERIQIERNEVMTENNISFENLEKQISEKGLNETLFRVCRQFYLTYPQIHSTVSNEFKLVDFGNCSTLSNEFMIKPDVLVQRLSF